MKFIKLTLLSTITTSGGSNAVFVNMDTVTEFHANGSGGTCLYFNCTGSTGNHRIETLVQESPEDIISQLATCG